MAKTLCDWSKGEIERRAGKLLKLVCEPRFFCRRCARVPKFSANPENCQMPEASETARTERGVASKECAQKVESDGDKNAGYLIRHLLRNGAQFLLKDPHFTSTFRLLTSALELCPISS